MRIAMALGALILLPSLALGQGPPGTNIVVDVRITEVTILGNRARVEYVLENSAESIEQLFQFTVDAPSPVLSILRPQPEQDWKTRTAYRTQSVARWTVLGEQMAPGDLSPALVFEAVGLPGIVTNRVRGYVPPPPLTDAGPVVAPSDPLIENSVAGKTVGVEPFPDDLSPINLVRRLGAFTDQTCGDLGWITNPGVCNSLKKKLENAERSIGRGRTNAAQRQLGAFLTELQAQRGKHVNDSAYWLLKVNAEFVLSQL